MHRTETSINYSNYWRNQESKQTAFHYDYLAFYWNCMHYNDTFNIVYAFRRIYSQRSFLWFIRSAFISTEKFQEFNFKMFLYVNPENVTIIIQVLHYTADAF